MASNLVPKRITDKNGVSSTRWVKPDASTPVSSKLPRLAFSPSPKAEAKRIGSEIRKYRNETDFSDRTNSWSHNDFSHFRTLIEEGDVESLRVIQKLLPLDSSYRPGHIGFVFNQLRRHEVENVSELVTEETLDAREALVKALDKHGMKNGIPYLSEREGSEDVYLMAFTDTEDVQRIITIIGERGLMAPGEIRGILSRMDETPVPLQQGTL